mgnify:CR=1 FL=1
MKKDIKKSKITKNGKIDKEKYKEKNITTDTNVNKNPNLKRIFKMFNTKRIIVLIVIAFLISMIGVIVQYNRVKKEKIIPKYANNVTKDDIIVARVRDSNEYDRMKIYLGSIIDDINNKRYDILYSKLYPKFKENYFKTEAEFKRYLELVYPQNASIVHKNFEKIGDYYVLEVGIINSNNLTDYKNIDKTYFVFKESGFNNYYFSFSKN